MTVIQDALWRSLSKQPLMQSFKSLGAFWVPYYTMHVYGRIKVVRFARFVLGPGEAFGERAGEAVDGAGGTDLLGAQSTWVEEIALAPSTMNCLQRHT